MGLRDTIVKVKEQINARRVADGEADASEMYADQREKQRQERYEREQAAREAREAEAEQRKIEAEQRRAEKEHQEAQERKTERRREFNKTRQDQRDETAADARKAKAEKQRKQDEINENIKDVQYKQRMEKEREKTQEFKEMAKRSKASPHKPQKMLPFREAAKEKITDELGNLFRPIAAVDQGRRKRKAANESRMLDPFGQLAAPRPKQRRASRATRQQVNPGTGFLFSEGFFTPKKVTKRTGKSRKRDTFDMGDMLL